MKKKNLKSLKLNKKSISQLNYQEIKGGVGFTFLNWCSDDESCKPRDTVNECPTNGQICHEKTLAITQCQTCDWFCNVFG